ncbi:zinc ABC transporter substrate-binding protein [Defluviimonas sp. SAOS-178_SWC]|uniref:zinc ABC transporter substrate-binding protein n=1 Tax=Defluviimonas sp. SAOS-178_SWC TaxID=3121287 RepID=UPI0032213A51
MRRPLSLAATLTVLALPAWSEVPDVVTDIPVVHSLVSAVLGDLGNPMLLLDKGADAHDFQLRPSQVRALNGADLVIWVGPGMTPWLDRAIAGADGPISVVLLDVPRTTLRQNAEAEMHAAAADTGTEEESDHEHEHGGLDPHAWLDPDNAALWIGRIADALADLDPGNAVAYRANASLAQARIETLDRALGERLAPAKGAGLMVAHDAYGYFADHYGLTIVASLASGDAASPGAAHLTDLRAALDSGAVACIFPEAAHDPAPVEALAEGAPVRIGKSLDPEGRAMEPGPNLYPDLMTAMADTIADCVAGD